MPISIPLRLPNPFTTKEGGVSNTKIGTFVAAIGALATVWGWDLDPRWVQTLAILGGWLGIVGVRDALTK